MLKVFCIGACGLLLVGAVAFFVSKGSSEEKASSGGNISVSDLVSRLESGAPLFVLDVREPQEHEAMHINGSVLIPLGELEQRLAEVPTDRPVVVYCRSGRRSAQAVSILRAHGVENVSNLEGGMTAWIAARACDVRKNGC